MSGRVSPVAPFGSLLKTDLPSLRKRAKRVKRDRDDTHLALVRRCPCLSCDNDPAGEAAHVRMTIAGKEITGTGTKPDDRWTLPLCPDCHTRHRDAQHRVGEVAFWSALGLDPLAICTRLYDATGSVAAMRAVIFKEREGRK